LAGVVLGWGGGAAGQTATVPPSSSAGESRPADLGQPPDQPGHHDLYYQTKLEGQPLKLAYAIYLPADYAKTTDRKAMIVFLHGAGEVGERHEGLYVHGPAAELKRNKDLAAWAPFAILSPVCPPGKRWESPGMASVVLDLARQAAKTWRIDPSRVYLTGLSMGGQGTWVVAATEGANFAAIAPICAPEVDAARVAASLKKQNTTTWLICGGADGGYTEGSRHMAEALRQAKADMIYTEVPDRGHDLWETYYWSKAFYEFLLLHRRGQPVPANRPSANELKAIARTEPATMDAKLAEPFKKFLPWWQLLNCGADMEPGLRQELRGRRNVFVTHPLDSSTPCRLQTTVSVPKNKKTVLNLVISHDPRGDWELVVRVAEQEALRVVVGPETAKDGWLEKSVDLTSYAGQDVRIELLNSPTGWNYEAAYWGKVAVLSTAEPAPTTASTLPVPPAAFRPLSMAYVLQADSLAESREQAVEKLRDCGRDLVVIDASYKSGEGGSWTRADLEAIRAGREGRKVVAYLSIGEAEDYRPYWKKSWDTDRDGKPDPGAPAFLCPENPDWAGNYRVRYWHKPWQEIILAAVDAIVAQGFDGLYLDIVDGFEYFERDGDKTVDDRKNSETGNTYRQDTVRWVTLIAQRARAKAGPGFLVIPQNGDQLLADAAYLKTVSAIGVEDLFTDGRRKQSPENVEYRRALLKKAVAAGKPVLVIEYPTNDTLRTFVADQARAQGFTLLITDRDLKTLGAVPPAKP
jgi:cysteinyl-tRNA synthetase